MPRKPRPKALDDMWGQAFAKPGTEIPQGRLVFCDICDQDYTDSDAQGGFIFGSYAYCPSCAAKRLPEIESYGEKGHIRAFCPEGKSFADFVREYRGPDATISVTTFE